MLKDNEFFLKLPLSWKKALILVLLSLKSRYCAKCEKDSISSGCVKKINQSKEFAPNLNETKRRLSNAVGFMLPWCVFDLDEYQRSFSFKLCTFFWMSLTGVMYNSTIIDEFEV